MIISPRKLSTLLDRLQCSHLVLLAAVLTLSSSIVYWTLSRVLPSHGLVYAGKPLPASFLEALYFSIVTEATLGYGDISPLGLSRLVACLQVISGLILAGLTIAKITSIQGLEFRLTGYRSSGDWIEFATLPDGTEVVGISRIYDAGGVIRYDGKNFARDGELIGFFDGWLIEIEGTTASFRYSNHQSDKHFIEGVASVIFTPDQESGKWCELSATAHDFGTSRNIKYVGYRCSDLESAVVRGSDLAARSQLIVRRSKEHFARR
jgi:hypothetical protein